MACFVNFFELRSTLSGTFFANSAVISAKSDDSIGNLLNHLNRGNVWGAPILNAQKPSLNNLVGWVDVLDMAAELAKKVPESVDLNSKKFTKQAIHQILEKAHELMIEKCESVINSSKRDPLFYIPESESLMAAVKMLEEAHRVIVKDNNAFVGIVSQMDVAEFLLKRHTFKKSSLDKPMNEIGLHPNMTVESVSEDTTTLAALRRMSDLKLSGLAILNPDGSILTSFSASDFLGLTEDKFILLTQSVKEFLNGIHGFLQAPVNCRPTDTLEKILLQIHLAKVHRIFVTDDNLIPKGFISLTDIMKFLGKNTERGSLA